MKLTFYITDPDSHGWSLIRVKRDWDVTVPIRDDIEKNPSSWQPVGIVNDEGGIEAFTGPDADRGALEYCCPLKPGTSITMEDE